MRKAIKWTFISAIMFNISVQKICAAFTSVNPQPKEKKESPKTDSARQDDTSKYWLLKALIKH